RQLRAVGAGDTYWTMPSQDRIAFALSVSPDPASPERVAGFRASAEQHPVRALMRDGARVLELGCGVAGQLVTCLQAFPAMTAVGVELSDDLADIAEQRAAALGVGDRLRVVRGDAADFADPEPFDVAHWSQFFFPAASRAGAVRAMFGALRPGGLAYLPLPWDFEEYDARPTSGATRDYRLMRVVLASWGVPEARYEDLAAELTAGGFVDVALIRPAGDVPRVIARRP
ncbi:MAG: SAM-dependent methyltransferase, partial [Nocardioides sp.]